MAGVSERKKLGAVLSNRFELLYQELKEALTARPALSHCIIVPDRGTERFLQTHLSQELPTELFSNIQVCSAKAAIPALSHPRLSEMQLLGYHVASELHLSDEEEQCLARFFGTPVERKRTLAHHIAEKAALSVWWGIEAKETHDTPLSYEAILHKLVKHAVEACAPSENALRVGAISLFAFSSLNPCYHQFLCDLSEKVAVDYYVLSPCLFFWSDVCSDGEAKKIERHLAPHRPHVDIEGLLFDRHPLLANSGTLGKHFARSLEESIPEVREAYVLPSAPIDQPIRKEVVVGVEGGHSLLRWLQTDILLLQGKRKECVMVSAGESNIQVVGAPTLLREVEALYHKVREYAMGTCEVPRIVVLAPDMERYVPYLYRLFGATEIPFWIDDRVRGAPRPLLSGFFLLLEFGSKRWSREEILQLFQCAAFRRKQGLELEAIGELARASREAHVSWDSLEGSFANFGRAIFERGYGADMEAVSADMTTTEILAQAFHTIRSLFSKMGTLPEEGYPLNHWVMWWRELLLTFFSPDHADLEEAEDYRQLLEAFDYLEKMALADTTLDADYATQLLTTTVREGRPQEMPPLQGVLCSSLGMLQSVPATLVCLIGMEEAAAGRKGVAPLLELGYLHSAPDLFPGYLEKQFFLDAVLSARDGLFISYQSVSQEDRTPMEPSTVVQELLQALDGAYSIEGKVPSTVLRSYESIDPLIDGTRAHQGGALSTPSAPTIAYPHIVELSFLRDVARSPLEPYFQGLGVALHSGSPMREQRFTLREWELRAALQGQPVGAFASPIWEKAAHLRVQEAKESLHGACCAWGVSPDARMTFEFSLQCKRPQEIAKNHFLLPAITVAIPTECGVQLMSCVGRIDDQLEAGYLCFGANTLGTMARQLPDILFRACARTMLAASSEITCFFVKDQKARSLALKDPVATLGAYVRFAYACQQEALCLYPDWMEPLVRGKAFSDMHFPEECPYRELLFRREGATFFHSRWPRWQEWACDLCADLVGGQHDAL